MLKSLGSAEVTGEGAFEGTLEVGAGCSEMRSSTGLGGLGALSSCLDFSRVFMALLTRWVPCEAAITEGSMVRMAL